MMNRMQKVRDGLSILLKYNPDGDTAADHDIIYAASIPMKNIAADDLKQLDDLGWFWDQQYECWAHFT